MTTKENAAGGTKARRYHTLDGMRGVAAIIVLLAHALRNTPNETSIRAALAVTMFFLLSGFVLGKAYDERLKAGMSLGQFTLARLIRLYPLWLLSLAIAVAGTSVTLLLGHGKMNLQQFVASAISALFFLPTPMPYDVGETMPLNPPGWSLFFELVANFIFGAFHARLTNRNLVILIVGCLMLLLIGKRALLGFRVGISQCRFFIFPGRIAPKISPFSSDHNALGMAVPAGFNSSDGRRFSRN